ncbi:unnamed protein product [Calypogeia fissa]
MGAHLSRFWDSQATPKKEKDKEKEKNGSEKNSKTSSPKHNKHHHKVKEKGNLRRHHTVAQIHGTDVHHHHHHGHHHHHHGSEKAHHPTLFRHASHGDFRAHFHDDLKMVSKRFNQVLGRSESARKEDKEVVIYKQDFQTKYFCNLSSPLSHGRYATVTLASSCLTDQNVAVKIISKDKLFDKKSGKRCAGENVRVEVIALRNLSNEPNVVKFLDVYEDEAFFYVVMELCKGGNLLERINKAGPMKEEQAGPLLKQMLTVTQICHSHGIAHRDLKLENFVFLSDTEDYPLNLVDFGSAAFFKHGESRPFKGAVGTFNYMAPEVYDSSYGASADVWSLGIIGFALLCSFLPYTADSYEELRDKIMNEEVAFSQPAWEHVSESAKILIKKMLDKDPDFRITTAEALAHPWLTQWNV